MSKVKDLHKQWLDDPEYRKEYEGLAPEFALAQALIEAREKAGLKQEDVAELMETTQSVIARLEGAGGNPTLQTIARYAQAIGGRLEIHIVK